MEDRSPEIQRLQTCIDNLNSLLASPPPRGGREPPQMLAALLDELLRMLRLDFAYAWLEPRVGGSPVEMCRTASRYEMLHQPREVGQTLAPWLTRDTPNSGSVVPNPVGEGKLSIVNFGLKINNEKGVVVAGAERTKFPTDIETLLLRLAVNQTIIELQRAQVPAAHERAGSIQRAPDDLSARNIDLGQETEQQWGEIVGQCMSLQRVLKLVEQVAPTNACVLIEGETGTGKELIARAVHRLSDRKARAFVKLNCAAIPTGLMEAELFGHEKDAFTGAVAKRIGRFELADGGTIFLDEVGDVPLELQSKLLRVLQEQEFEQLGSPRTTRVNVRLVAASNRDLARMVKDREFRSDLYYRLKVFPLTLPPLRERIEDIPLLVRHFTKRHARQLNKPITTIAAETMTALCRYPWPGNVREMENFIERSVILSQGSELETPLGELRAYNTQTLKATTLEDIEREHIVRALNESDWVIAGRSGAAARLSMKRTSLQYKMQKLGITRPH